MKRKIILLATFLLLLPESSNAKAAFLSMEKMIQRSDAIAIVDIIEVKETEKKSGHWTFRQIATGKVQQVLKGELDKKITLHGNENFICARHNFEVGRAILFLKKTPEILTGSNWHLSIRKITTRDTIMWFENSENIRLFKTPLSHAVQQIKEIVLAQQLKNSDISIFRESEKF